MRNVRTFPLRGPIKGIWTNESKQPAVNWKSYMDGHGEEPYYGVAIPEGILIIDVDSAKDPSIDYLKELSNLACEAIDWGTAIIQHTPSGGAHYAFKIPINVNLEQRSLMKNVDVRIGGKGYIATGPNYDRIIEAEPVEYLLETKEFVPLPSKFITILSNSVSKTTSEEVLLSYQPIKISYEEASKWVYRVNPEKLSDYNTWINLTLAMKRIALDNPNDYEDIKALWDDVSSQAPNYNEENNNAYWITSKPTSASIETIKRIAIDSVSWWVSREKEEGIGVTSIRKDILSCRIDRNKKYKICSDYGLKYERNLKFDKIDINPVKDMPDKYVIGTSLYTKEYIDFIFSKYKISDFDKKSLLDWVYVINTINTNYYYNFESGIYCSRKNVIVSTLNIQVVCKETGEIIPAIKVLEKIIQPVLNIVYEPTKDKIFIADNTNLVYGNTYRAVEHKSKESNSSHEAVIRHNQHIYNILKKEDGDSLRYQIARIIQRKTKTGMAVLMQGAQGCGKTYFKSFFEATLGVPNVKAVDYRKIIEGRFDDWKVGSIVNCLEEVKPEGRYVSHFAERLKEVITADYFSVERKFQPSVTMRNHSNYIAFTNHLDAVALEQFDRRWLILKCNQQTKKDIVAMTKDNPDYFKLLFNDLVEHADVLYNYYMELVLPKEEEERVAAPMNRSKEIMIETNRPQDEIDMEEFLFDVINNTLIFDIFYSKTVLDINKLYSVFLNMCNNDSTYNFKGYRFMSRKKFQSIMSRLGWIYFDRYSDGNRRYCIYYNPDFDNYWNQTNSKLESSLTLPPIWDKEILDNNL